MNKHEQKFYTALSDLFVGAEVDGVGGFIKLMKFKRQYYQSIEPILKDDIDNALAKNPSFREELFEKLYQFFSLYFTQNGCIYFNHTPFHNQIYDKVYNGKDVALFWKTNMLYYVKSDKLWRSLPIKFAGYDFYFDATELEQKANNTKNGLVYAFKDVTKTPEGKPQINFVAKLSSHGNKTKIDEIRNALTKQSINLSEEEITKLFAIFEKQNEVDFFINKDAKAFLTEQFKLWIYQYFWNGSDDWSVARVEQLTILKNIANKVINFIGQFEDELVKIWNKPKFVRNSNYVVTLDKLIAKGLDIALLTNHAGMQAQIQEWQDLGIVDEKFNINEITQAQDMFADSKYKYLPFDTKHFDEDIKYAILGLFDNLDDECDGVLIKSDNYQALNTIMPKYKEQATCIYIDPPYNTNATEIIYKNGYRNSSWISYINDRLLLGFKFLATNGVHIFTIDDAQIAESVLLINSIFDAGNHLATVPIRNNPQGRSTVSGFSINHEYAIFHRRSEKLNSIGRLARTVEQLNRYREIDENNNKYLWENFRKTGTDSLRDDRPKQFYPLFVNIDGTIRVPKLIWQESSSSYELCDVPLSNELIVYPIDENKNERVWKWGIERCIYEMHHLKVSINESSVEIYRRQYLNEEGKLPGTWWDNAKYAAGSHGTDLLSNIFGKKKKFDFAKSLYAVMDCLQVAMIKRNNLTIDFFAGSGTTAHAVINLNRNDGQLRKYLLVEMGEHFYNVVLPRVKKLVFSEKWKNGNPQDSNGISQLVKYYELEQYEEALAKCQYKDHEVFDEQSPYSSYVFMADEKLLTDTVSITDKQVKIDLTKLYPDIDIAETLSNLLGKKIAKQSKNSVTFTDGETIDLTNLDLATIKPLLWWS